MSIEQLQEQLQRHLVYLEQDANNLNLQLSIGLLKAQILHHQQLIPHAISLLESFLSTHSLNDELHGVLSFLYFEHEDAANAHTFSEKALSLNAQNYNGLLVQTLLKALLHKANVDDINYLLSVNPEECRLWFILGTTQLQQMNIHAATEALLKATTYYPDFYDCWICLGLCYLLQNKIDLAKGAYQQAVKIEPNAADGLGGMALVHALNNQMDESVVALQYADSIDNTCFLAAIARIILANKTDPNEAVQQFNITFPGLAPEISRLLSNTILGHVNHAPVTNG